MPQPVISRIAPTPSGFLHLGNAFNFLLTALLVDLQNGHLHLRIDDLDRPRVVPVSVEDIFVQLEWLGIEYDSGPSGPDELFKQYSQHTRMELYADALQSLAKSGTLYACECSRSKIRQLSINGNYPETCRLKELDLQNDKLSWRVHIPEQTYVSFKTLTYKNEKINVSQAMGDFVVKRRDGIPAYQLASVMDDLELGVNFVVRGEDLRASTAAQLFLAQCLNDQIFPATRFVHHQLITDNSGNKLSKSAGALSLKLLREKHQSPVWIYQETAKSLKLPFQQIQTLDNLKEVFRSTMLQKHGLQALFEQGG
ncbi:MAG: glutamate--tRNA ligase family protein [SAR324 cluster bacterium]|nr:glutamate--tRNA ligase family protein [SAR324 cluster bacterium]